jgi:hypothetical protein
MLTCCSLFFFSSSRSFIRPRLGLIVSLLGRFVWPRFGLIVSLLGRQLCFDSGSGDLVMMVGRREVSPSATRRCGDGSFEGVGDATEALVAMGVLSSSAPPATGTGTSNADTEKQCHLSMDVASERPTGT